MRCATCHDPMIVVEYEHVELDYCPNCAGVWFDSGEVELLLETMEVDSTGLEGLHLAQEAASKEKKHRCPGCDRGVQRPMLSWGSSAPRRRSGAGTHVLSRRRRSGRRERPISLEYP